MFLGHGVDEALAQAADLLVGEGAVGGPEAQPEGQALLRRSEGVGAEDVEQADVFEEVAGGATQGAPSSGMFSSARIVMTCTDRVCT